tara:strand:+ start:270 stop:1013 length:744 start_codon:yes stop_codon:yes gene_type:complete
MSVKSLLQLILLVLIFFILGGIYFVYFYSGPLKNKLVLNENINKLDNKKIEKEYFQDQEVLEKITLDQKNSANKNGDRDLKANKVKNEKKKFEIKDTSLKETETDKIKNLTKEIEYITSNKEGDIFKILAKYGKTNIKNSDILDLKEVEGIISSSKRSDIYITSDFAEYNYDNQNSKFYSNVIIKYDNKVITCDNLDLKIKTNYAIAYNNVEIKDDNSVMKAQLVRLNILTKDIEINSQDKIKIITN